MKLALSGLFRASCTERDGGRACRERMVQMQPRTPVSQSSARGGCFHPDETGVRLHAASVSLERNLRVNNLREEVPPALGVVHHSKVVVSAEEQVPSVEADCGLLIRRKPVASGAAFDDLWVDRNLFVIWRCLECRRGSKRKPRIDEVQRKIARRAPVVRLADVRNVARNDAPAHLRSASFGALRPEPSMACQP